MIYFLVVKKLLFSINRIWLLIAIISFGMFYFNSSSLLKPYNADEISKAYSLSQYVLGDKSPQKISDGTLYEYAASAYFRGEDPTTINFEHPPLGKYIYGLSLWLTGKIQLVNIFFFAGSLVLFVTLLRQFKVPEYLQVVGVTYLAVFSSLGHHLSATLLDLQTLFWSLFFFVVLFYKKESWKKYFGIGIILGAFVATKYFFPIIFLYLGLFFIWAVAKKTLLKSVLSVVVMGIIYLLSYTAYFLNGHTPIDFIKFEWFRFRWWTGNRTIPKFIILQTLFLGKFPMWWEDSGKYMKDGDWNISWPILFVAHLVSLIWQKLSLMKVIILLFSFGLLFIFMFGSAVYGRYILQLIPFWLLLLGSGKYVSKKI